MKLVPSNWWQWQMALAVVALGFALAGPAFCEAGDADTIRTYFDTEVWGMDYSTDEKAKTQTYLVNYPVQATELASRCRETFRRKGGKPSLVKEGVGYKLVNLVDNETIFIKCRYDKDKPIDIPSMEALSRLFPHNIRLSERISGALESQGQYAKALEYYKRARKVPAGAFCPTEGSAKSRSEVAANCAYFELKMGHFETAIKELSAAIDLSPDDKVNYQNRAAAYERMHKPDLAARDRQKRAELAKIKGPPANLLQGEANNLGATASKNIDLGYLEDGMIRVDRALRLDPKCFNALFMRACLLLRLGRYKESEKAFRDYWAVYPKAKNIKERIAIVSKLVKTGPPPFGNAEVLKASRERLFPGRKKGIEGTITAEELAADHKGDYRVYEAMCDVYKQRRDLKHLREGLMILARLSFCADNDVVANLIDVDFTLRDWNECETYCNQYLELMDWESAERLNSDYIQFVYTRRSQCRKARKDPVGAIADDTTILSIEPDSAETYRDRADLYMLTNKYEKAVADYTQSIKLDQDQTPGNYLGRASAYDKLNKPYMAKQDREKAATLGGAANSKATIRAKIKPAN